MRHKLLQKTAEHMMRKISVFERGWKRERATSIAMKLDSNSTNDSIPAWNAGYAMADRRIKKYS